MVSKHNQQPFADVESYQFSHKHSRQVSCSSRLASYFEIPPCGGIPEKSPTSDEEVDEVLDESHCGEKPVCDTVTESSVNVEKRFGSRIADDHYKNDPGNLSSLSWVTCADDVARSEHNKRPLTTDELQQIEHKRPRQFDYSVQAAPFVLPSNALPEKLPTPVAASKELEKRSDIVLEDSTVNASCSMSSLSRVTCRPTVEDIGSESPIRISFSPCFVENEHQASGFIQPEKIYSSIFDYLPRKQVAVGPDHQADIPAWSPWGIKSSSSEFDPSSVFHHVAEKDDNEKFMGTSVIAMPDGYSAVWIDPKVGAGRSDCDCHDEGSIRCVRQHIMEAREKLQRTLGQVKFVELGFCDVGEYVAQKWTEEEEHAFHEVVFANPASLGRNFWDYLPQVFPFRSSKDLVSYYFNVFMLRKRAGQNRSDLLNVDSDDEEWQEGDDGESAMEEHEEDSVVESPVDEGDIYDNDGHEEVDFHEDEDGDASDDLAAATAGHDQEFCYVSKGQFNSKSTMDKDLQDVEDHHVQDDSCTSYEGQYNGTCYSGDPVAANHSDLKGGHKKLQTYRSDDLGCSMDLGYHASPCDPKTWDICYFTRGGNGLELLPTCHVIEEVFGKGSWDKEARDGQGIS